MTTKTVSTQRTTITTAEVAQDPTKRSIRQICLTMIREGKTTAEITTVVQAEYPTSAAAAKPAKHIAWYRAWNKKNPIKVEETSAE